MKSKSNRSVSILLLVLLIGSSCHQTESSSAPFDYENEWKSGFFICWRGNVEENIRSAKALGYRYINETSQNATRIKNYKDWPQSEGMRFYLDNPEFSWVPAMPMIEADRLKELQAQSFGQLFEFYPKLSQRVKDEWFIQLKEFDPDMYQQLKPIYEKYYCIIDGEKEFPYNLALGWKFRGGDARLMLDWQQKAVIDSVVERVVELAYERQSIEKDYLFTGITMDVPSKWAEFDRPIAYDTVAYDDFKLDCGLSAYAMPGVTHDYPTFREGWMRFMLAMRKRLDSEFSDREIRFILEPWKVWGDGYCGKWSYWIANLHGSSFLTDEEKKLIAGDLIMMEGNFVNQYYDSTIIKKVLSTGLITYDQVAISSPNLKERYYEEDNPDTHLRYIGELSKVGGWFNSYGRFNSSLTSIKERLPQLTLSRLLVNWQNLSRIPLEQRHWDESLQVFDCPIGHADKDIIYGKEPHSGKYFVVWVSEDGVMQLPEGKRVISAVETNEYCEQTGEGTSEALASLQIKEGEVTLRKSGKLNQTYILTLE